MQFARNETCCVEDNQICISNVYAKDFSDLNLNLAVIGKVSFFQENASNFTYSWNLWYLKYN